MICFRKARLNDIPAMQALVAPEVESGLILARADDEVSTNIRSYTLAFYGEELVGFVALHIHTADLAEIRSLIVSDSYRGRSIGSDLVKRGIEEAQELRLGRILSLTYQKEFFEHLGFKEIPKESLPEHKIWADCIKCKHFPVCNEVSLILAL